MAAMKASNENYANAAKLHHRVKEFEEGALVTIHLRRERILNDTYHKLKSKKS